jgi:NAD(P)-dependent dehydrogenase (short-subunit alcohol dehydrogenase family)
MDVDGRTAIVTGGAHGIGRALVQALAIRGARVVVADVNTERAERIAERVGGLAVTCDVGDPASITAAVSAASEAYGPVDIAVSNAGMIDPGPDLDSSPEQLRRVVDVNMMAHVWMAQAVVGSMVDRGGGALIQTISSAALITGPSGLGYTMSKHGALGFAEWMALNYAPRGIRVVCLCPNAVNTGFLGRDEDGEDLDRPASDPDPAAPNAALIATLGDVVEPEACAAAALSALDDGRFLALPHPRVGESFARKGSDYDAWLSRTTDRLARMRAAAEAGD